MYSTLQESPISDSVGFIHSIVVLFCLLLHLPSANRQQKLSHIENPGLETTDFHSLLHLVFTKTFGYWQTKVKSDNRSLFFELQPRKTNVSKENRKRHKGDDVCTPRDILRGNYS